MKRTKQHKKQTNTKKLLSTKSGTATSSPQNRKASPTNKISATLWYLKKGAYVDTTIKAVGKRLRHICARCGLHLPV